MASQPETPFYTSSDIENQLLPSQPPSPPKKAHQHPRYGALRPVSSRPALRALSNNICVSEKVPAQIKRTYGDVLADEARTINRADVDCRNILREKTDGTTSIKRVSRKKISILRDSFTPPAKEVFPGKPCRTAKATEVEEDDCLEVTNHRCIKLGDVAKGSDFSVDLGEVPLPSIESPGPEYVTEICIPSSPIDLDPMFASDNSFVQPRHSRRSRNVSPSDQPRLERFERRFGTVLSSSSLDLDIDFDDAATRQPKFTISPKHSTMASDPTKLRPIERSHTITIYKLPGDEDRRAYVLREILTELAHNSDDAALKSHLVHNQHHALIASHVIHAHLAYNNGVGILGFLETPLTSTGLWHKTQRAGLGDSYDHMYGVLYRLVEQGTIEQWKEMSPYHKGEASVLYRVFHDQLSKVDHAFEEFGKAPVVVEMSSWITSLLHIEQQVDSTDRTILEMLVCEANDL
ncbi:hypothetical protein EJ05DRAFT_277143 [Pseudovirgaria hyperparasitica]|uniref:Uncharacterized protein n=1 Tax=Pseudovirgaria hyperparasitica TaxID=470096 RepID=A0A6A6WDJ5_9PEZI|nr:uncharacterized protein EJ05DRAFT_277143 [Pseudovirgaria hyperparasitica]KAF2760249.1 hypothetical protein EJ05DRAFT_277143 [Pseudovirgaria hyperparasitica]